MRRPAPADRRGPRRGGRVRTPRPGRLARWLRLLTAGAVLSSGLVALAPAEQAAAATITTKVSTYGSASRAEVLTAYYDARRSGAPWLVDVHGGYWRGGSHRSDAAWAKRMAAHGYQVFVVDYPKEMQAAWPAQRTSVTAAIAWIRARASTYHIDPQRLAVVGSSAGGQIAMNTAANLPRGLKSVATVSFAGVNSPWDAYRAAHDHAWSGTGDRRTYLADAATLLLGCPRSSGPTCSARWEDAEATKTFGRDDGALAAWHCSGDPVVPVSHSRAAVARVKAHGVVDATLHESTCEEHVVAVVPGVEAASTRWLDVRLGRGQSSAAWRASR